MTTPPTEVGNQGPRSRRVRPRPYLRLGGQRALLHNVLDHGLASRLLQVAVMGHGTDHLHHGPLHLPGPRESGKGLRGAPDSTPAQLGGGISPFPLPAPHLPPPSPQTPAKKASLRPRPPPQGKASSSSFPQPLPSRRLLGHLPTPFCPSGQGPWVCTCHPNTPESSECPAVQPLR